MIEAPDHVSARYRLQAFIPALARAGCTLVLEPIPAACLNGYGSFHACVALMSSCCNVNLLPVLEYRFLRRMARRLIYDFDDAMLYRDSYHPRGHSSVQRARRFSAIVRSSDTVIAGNAFLKDCAIESGARRENVAVIPTCVEPEKYPPRSASSRAQGLEMVWIGSSSTLAGLERQRPLLQRLGREIPGLRLRLICDRFVNFDPLPVIQVVWAEATEAASIAQADFGISWMPDDAWSKGKCGLKVLQYGAARIPTIANPVGVHREIIADGVTGLLAATEDQWLEAVRTLARDPVVRAAMGTQARLVVEQSYSVAAHAA